MGTSAGRTECWHPDLALIGQNATRTHSPGYSSHCREFMYCVRIGQLGGYTLELLYIPAPCGKYLLASTSGRAP